MDNTTTKKYRAKGTRVLADGTTKEFYYNKSYTVKNGVDDKRFTKKLTPEQKEEVWTKYCADVKIKRICADLGIPYGPVKKCIDKKKAEIAAVAKSPIDPLFDYSGVK